MSLNSWWLEDEGHNHKYDPIPEEPPRHHKKTKKRHAKSDHKHIYEEVCIDAHTYSVTRKGRVETYHLGLRCRVCGRLQDVWYWRFNNSPPDDMPLYEVEDFWELLHMKCLPEEKKVRG